MVKYNTGCSDPVKTCPVDVRQYSVLRCILQGVLTREEERESGTKDTCTMIVHTVVSPKRVVYRKNASCVAETNIQNFYELSFLRHNMRAREQFREEMYDGIRCIAGIETEQLL